MGTYDYVCIIMEILVKNGSISKSKRFAERHKKKYNLEDSMQNLTHAYTHKNTLHSRIIYTYAYIIINVFENTLAVAWAILWEISMKIIHS